MRKKLNLVIVIGLVLVISYLSLTPNPPVSDTEFMLELPLLGVVVFSSLSTIGHFSLYFLLAGALLTYFHDTRIGHVEAFTIAVVFGALIEFLQLYVPNRYFAFQDILINAVGASIIFLDHKVVLVSRFVDLEDKFIEKYFL